jgi:hypothetical protein
LVQHDIPFTEQAMSEVNPPCEKGIDWHARQIV